MTSRKKQPAAQLWRTGWRMDVIKLRDGVSFKAPQLSATDGHIDTMHTIGKRCSLSVSRETDRVISSTTGELEEGLATKGDPLISKAWKWWKSIGSPTWVLAPMVAQSDLAFRLLCRQEGVSLCYTPMYLAERVNSGVHDAELMIAGTTGTSQIIDRLESCLVDRPLVCQLAGRNIDALVQAGLRIQDSVDAIDLNFGCPQRCAEDAGFGAFLLESDPDLACAIVAELTQVLRIPVLAKMRLHPNGPVDTVQIALKLQAAGASAITLHARQRWQREHEGPAEWRVIRMVKRALHIPVIANGSIQCLEDAKRCLEYTEADAVMSGTGLLRHPTLFTDSSIEGLKYEIRSSVRHENSSSNNNNNNDTVSALSTDSAAAKAIYNCYRYLDIVDDCIERWGTAVIAVNGRDVCDVVRDHLMAMLQVHVMGVHKELCSRLLSASKDYSSTTDNYRETLKLIAAKLEISAGTSNIL